MSIAAEALLAVCGLRRKKPITAAEGERAAKIPQQWRAKLKRVLRDDTAEFTPPEQIDVLELWEEILSPPGEAEQATLIEQMDGGELPTDYLAALSRAYEYLRTVWPVSKVERTFGPVLLPASTMETWRASGVWQVANDPGVVIDRMLSRSLTAEDVETMQAIYPQLYQMCAEILSEEASQLVASRPAYEPSAAADYALRTFLGVPPDAPIAQVSGEAPQKSSAQTHAGALDFESKFETKAQRLGQK